jgi:hypothetical protein
MREPEFAVRRSRVVTGLNAGMATLVTVASAWFGFGEAIAGGTSLLAVVTVVTLLAVYSWNATRNFLDGRPLLVVAPEGIWLPQHAQAPIPWHAIQRVGASRSFALVGGGRLDLDLAAEAFVQVRVGQRLMGDHVVKMVGTPFGISLLAQGLDHPASDVLAAIGRYWPPRDASDDASG